MNIRKAFFATLLSCLVFSSLFVESGYAFSLIKSWFTSDETAETKEKEAKEAEKPSAHIAKKKEKPTAAASKPKAGDGKTVVVFQDGTTVTEDKIREDLEEIPAQLSAKMSFQDIKVLLAWKAAFSKVMYEHAQKSGVLNDKKAQEIIKARGDTAIGLLLLEEMSSTAVTFEQGKKIYNESWAKHGKDKNELHLLAINTTNSTVSANLSQNQGTRQMSEVVEVLDKHKRDTKYMDLGQRNQSMYPPEIASAALKAGKGHTIGPFELGGALMFFFIVDISKAQKQKFDQEFFEKYKEANKKEFVNEFMRGLYAKHHVTFYKFDGSKLDPFQIVEQGKKNAKVRDFSKIKADYLMADIGGRKVCVRDVLEFFKVDSLLSEVFVTMSRQFGISLEDVCYYAAKVLTDDRILLLEAVETGFNKRKDIVEKCKNLERMELIHRAIQNRVKVTSADIKKHYNKFIQSIPDEDKNDQEIAVKMVFFPTKEAAARALDDVLHGSAKFTDQFTEQKGSSDGGAVDLGYVRRQSTPPELWALIKKGAQGTCCKQVIEVNGAQFGVKGNYAILYVSDRRPVSLPSLANPQEKAYFEALAFREQAIEFVMALMEAAVKSILGRPISEWRREKEYVHSILNMLVGTPTSAPQQQ
ncbi:MAG: peptidyl-prolyl cis-trans isomerase [Holosporales bacterium]|jgi:parvulin-like peptidyl-prolyl isomerase|nr:peptidyl-prolyl cis-trans isomerase [Holosporales bacterium]